jgi:uncharacterized membrane protein
MNPRQSVRIIFVVSLAGLVFSGVLTYRELFGTQALTCPSPGAPGTIFGYPACVYGFVMYAVIVGIALAGVLGKKNTT